MFIVRICIIQKITSSHIEILCTFDKILLNNNSRIILITKIIGLTAIHCFGTPRMTQAMIGLWILTECDKEFHSRIALLKCFREYFAGRQKIEYTSTSSMSCAITAHHVWFCRAPQRHALYHLSSLYLRNNDSGISISAQLITRSSLSDKIVPSMSHLIIIKNRP